MNHLRTHLTSPLLTLLCLVLASAFFLPVAAGEERADKVLQEQYGLEEPELTDPEELTTLLQTGDALQEVLRVRKETLGEAEQEARQVARILATQLENDALPAEARAFIALDYATTSVRIARISSEQRALSKQQEKQEALQTLLQQQLTYLSATSEESLEAHHRLLEAEEARQEALSRLALVSQREERELDQETRELLRRERELAQELADLTLHEEAQLRRLEEERRSRAEDFAEHRARINARMAEFPLHPRPETSREEVDPLFREVVEARRTARQQFREHSRAYLAAISAVEEQRAAFDTAQRQLERLQAGSIEESELVERRLAIAELRLKLAERDLEMGRDVLKAHRQKNRVLREGVAFYHDTTEALLPIISPEERQRFFTLRRDENWQDARDAVGHAAEEIRATWEERAEKLQTLPERLLSVPLWLWIFGLLWRCLLFPLAFFFGRDFSSQAVRRLTDWLLERRYFRRHAAFTVKGGEVLRALVEPALLFIATLVVVDYVAHSMVEFALLRWLLQAVFIYWMIMTAVKVLVLPRGYRKGEKASPRSGRFDQFDDIINLELSRATKIVSSTRIVLLFWLIAYYAPQFVHFVTGHNVLWRLVDRLAIWGLFFVVYVVLSTWRNEIALIFERLASQRMPRAASIIKEHQRRPWGVLLIGLASLYVTGAELARFGRAYLLDTQWTKSLGNFFFRKSIELQQRERDGEAELCVDVPESYRAWFHHRPLTDEAYMIERTALLERIEATYQSWLESPRKGAIAVVAEQGMGRTTLLNQVFHRWHLSEERDLLYLQLTNKIEGVSDLHEYVAALFGLQDPPDDPRAFAEALVSLPPKLIILDDCHHIFLRQIGGFEAIESFLKLVSMSDHHHFWLLSFNAHTWSYLNRVRFRGHFFIDVVEMHGWEEEELQEMIRKRDAMDNMAISFTELVIAHDDDDHHHYEIVRTSNGYFRLLHEFSQGNPSVALTFWLRSLTLDSESKLQVGLFPRPSLKTLSSLSDDYLFALASVAQHGSLTPVEVARTIHAYEGDCEMIVEYLADSDIVEIDPVFGRARIRPLFLRSVTRKLQDKNVLYG